MSAHPDLDKYRPFVDRFDLTEEQKTELIHTVWRIVEGFAYRAFGLDPVQRIVGRSNAEDASGEASMLGCEATTVPTTPLKAAFARKTRGRGRRKK